MGLSNFNMGPLLGKGSFGAVYRARRKSDNRECVQRGSWGSAAVPLTGRGPARPAPAAPAPQLRH